MMFDNKQMQIIEKAINGSEFWRNINARVKAVYEKENKIPSDEEYQALRTVLVCKTMLEDKEVFETVSSLMAKASYDEVTR